MTQPVSGIRLTTHAAGIKYRNRDDVVLIECAAGSSLACVVTQNACRAAPVDIAQHHVNTRDQKQPTYLLINSGNANAATGEQGYLDALSCCQAVAQATHTPTKNTLPFSTGVIGEPLPIKPIISGIPMLVQSLGQNNWDAASKAIMTTDTKAKCVSRSLMLDGEEVVITGMAKGSGMIQPNMATMLAYITTNATIAESDCQTLLKQAVEQSFNAISVDGDTSTNDACVLVATNQTRTTVQPDDAHSQDFVDALHQVALALALLLVKDGEGATKLVTIRVHQAHNKSQARTVAFGVANSPLVKTALFAADPNWGRLIMAIGNRLQAGTQPDIAITINDYQVVVGGMRAASYVEEQAKAAMRPDAIVLDIALGLGEASFTCYSCDFSHDYITINADYRS